MVSDGNGLEEPISASGRGKQCFLVKIRPKNTCKKLQTSTWKPWKLGQHPPGSFYTKKVHSRGAGSCSSQGNKTPPSIPCLGMPGSSQQPTEAAAAAEAAAAQQYWVLPPVSSTGSAAAVAAGIKTNSCQILQFCFQVTESTFYWIKFCFQFTESTLHWNILIIQCSLGQFPVQE